MPAYTQAENSYFASGERNYTMLYDSDASRKYYAALWVAYPLAQCHVSTGRSGSWAKTPDIAESKQINVWIGSYGVNVPNTSSDIYARGHQIPNADRNANSEMQKQTFYATNSTPQIQNGFNGTIWGKLEDRIRDAMPSSSTDTLYVATGPVYRTVGGSETISYISPQHDTKQCAVPNYYYKVVLKVKRNASNVVTSAMAIGYWLPHQTYASGYNLDNYVMSVDQIETKTGIDFFANLPDTIEATAEANTSWTTFTSF